MPRGGRRPGAGAPTGNTNALKHGGNSLRVRGVVAALMADPDARRVLLGLGATKSRRDPQVRELALAVARLMHDRPVAESARAAIDAIAEDRLAAWETDRYADDLAYYERTTGRDALTGDPLKRGPRRTAAQQRAIARVRKRLIEARQRLRDWQEAHAPEPPARYIPYLEMLAQREAEAAREAADRALLDLPPLPRLAVPTESTD